MVSYTLNEEKSIQFEQLEQKKGSKTILATSAKTLMRSCIVMWIISTF